MEVEDYNRGKEATDRWLGRLVKAKEDSEADGKAFLNPMKW